jgi:hypothetical protein
MQEYLLSRQLEEASRCVKELQVGATGSQVCSTPVPGACVLHHSDPLMRRCIPHHVTRALIYATPDC